MYSKTSLAGHPLHPMLVAFPTALYVLTFVGFLVYSFFSSDSFWYKLGFFSNVAAVISALVAAIPGFIDWAVGVPNKTQAKRDGLIHMVLNLLTLAFFSVNLLLISGTWESPMFSLGVPLVLTGVGCLILMGAGFYGWVMVGTHKVGVSMTEAQEEIQEQYEREERQDEPMIFH